MKTAEERALEIQASKIQNVNNPNQQQLDADYQSTGDYEIQEDEIKEMQQWNSPDREPNAAYKSYDEAKQKEADDERERRLLGGDDVAPAATEILSPEAPETPSVPGKATPEDSWFDKAIKEFKQVNPIMGKALETGEGAAKGAILALEQAANTALDVGDGIEDALAKLGFGSGDNVTENRFDYFKKKFEEPTTAAEHVGKILGQYWGPFALVSRLNKAKGVFGVVSNIGASAAVSAVVMDPDEKRLSDLVQASPALANPITALLASEKDDSRLESRLKNAAEAVIADVLGVGILKGGTKVVSKASDGVSVLADKMVSSVKAYKQARKVKVETAVPRPSVLPEEQIAANEAKINQGIQEEVAAAQKYTETPASTRAQAAPSGGGEPQTRPPTKAERMSELVAEYKATGRPIEAKDLHETARRGTISDEENLKLANKIREEGETRLDELFDRKFGTSLSQEERTALKLEAMTKQLEVENMVKGVDDIANLSPTEMALMQERLDSLQAFYASIDAASSESGRALRSSKMTPKGILEEGGDAIKKHSRVQEYIKQHGGTQSVEETLRAIKQIQDQGVPLYEAFEHHLNSVGKKFADSAFEVWINAALSGPKTMLFTNPVANWAMKQGMTIETKIAEGLGKLMGKGVVPGEVEALRAAFADAHYEALEAARQIFKKGTAVPASQRTRFMMERKNAISSQNYGLDPMSQIGRFADQAGHVINMPTRVLSAQDAYFNTVLRRGREGQLAHRIAIQKGLKPGSAQYNDMVTSLKQKPTPGMLKESERYAREGTMMSPLSSEQGVGIGPVKFTGDTMASLQGFLEKYPTGRYWGAFMRVGTNIADRVAQRTPLAFLRPETRQNIFGGTRASAQEEMGKMIFGTSILAASGGLAMSDLTTGSGPDDPKAKRALKSAGWQENSLRLPGGGFLPLRELGVIGEVMAIGSQTAELIGRIDSDDENASAVEDFIAASSMLVATAFTPEQLANGVPKMFDIIKRITSGDMTGPDIQKEVALFSKNFVPFAQGLRSVREVISDTPLRDTRSSSKSLLGAFEQVKNEWLQTVDIFGFNNMPPELNMFGEEIHPPMGVGTSIKSAIFSNADQRDDMVVKEILRLDMTGPVFHTGSENEESLAVRMPDRTKRMGIGLGDGATVPIKLSPQKYHDYVKLSAGMAVGDLKFPGPTLKEALKTAITSDAYKSQSNDAQKVILKEIISEYRSTAWKLISAQPDIMEEYGQKREKRLQRRLPESTRATIFGRGK